MTTVTNVETVTLKGGFVIALEVLQLAWRLEESGITLSVDPTDHALLVSPADQVSAEDVALLRQYKSELVRLLTYVAPSM
jgi:hypothetical protein